MQSTSERFKFNKTDTWKSLRDMLLSTFGVASGDILYRLWNLVDAYDFGQYELLAYPVSLFVFTAIYRLLRTNGIQVDKIPNAVKREIVKQAETIEETVRKEKIT